MSRATWRIHSDRYSGKHYVQKRTVEWGVWGDVGEPFDTLREAEQRLAECMKDES